METMQPHQRKSIRLAGYDYAQAGGYFVTVVAFRRECIFGEIVDGKMIMNPLGRIVEECWQAIPRHFPHVTVDVFVVMPNHGHGILFIHEDGATHANGRGEIYLAPTRSTRPHGYEKGSLGAIVANFKAAVTRRAGCELNSGNIWQRNYYEHILRNQADYEHKAGYILANPENWEQDEEH